MNFVDLAGFPTHSQLLLFFQFIINIIRIVFLLLFDVLLHLLSEYEDARRKSTDGINLVESAKIIKSIYAMYNVIYSLNANKRHVPYRESKITHMLKDSFDGMNRVLMITCLVMLLVLTHCLLYL